MRSTKVPLGPRSARVSRPRRDNVDRRSYVYGMSIQWNCSSEKKANVPKQEPPVSGVIIGRIISQSVPRAELYAFGEPGCLLSSGVDIPSTTPETGCRRYTRSERLDVASDGTIYERLHVIE